MMRLLEKTTSGRWYYPAIIVLLCFFTAMRLVHINADAPQDLTISAASYTDEGFKTYDARNYALFGDWKWTPEDEYEGWISKSPLTVIPYAFFFKRFGHGFAVIRALSVIYAALTMILLFLFLQRNYGRLTGLIGLLLFGANYFTAMFNRLGMYESHLIFYLMLSTIGFSEALRPSREQRNGEIDRAYNAKKIARALFFCMVGFFGIACGFFIKRNMLIVIPALLPAVILCLSARHKASARFMNRSFVAFIALFTAVYLIFAHLGAFKVGLAFTIMSYQVFGQPLAALLPFTAFDPLPNVIAKGMYMEFVFLQPFIFFTGFLYSLMTFHGYIAGTRRVTTDLFLSSWLVFGLIFTSVMYYSPSRYYLLLSIPLVSLSARFLADFAKADAASFFTGKKGFPHNLIFMVFTVYSVLYTGLVFLNNVIPGSLRNYLMDRLYPAFLKGDYRDAASIIVIAVLVWLFWIVLTIVNRKRLTGLLKDPLLPSILLVLILSLQLFQYGKWFIFHDHNLYTASKELGRELPGGSILAGSWSSGLVVENDLRPVIIQSMIPYNHNLIKKIIRDIDISVNRIRDGKKETVSESGIPIYLAVCKNVIFERTIVDLYSDHLLPKNLVKSVRFGYFKVEIYKMKKQRMEVKNAVQSLFNRLL